MGLADWIYAVGDKGQTYALDKREWALKTTRIHVPRIKLVLGKGQRRNRRRRLARTAPFVPFTLGWAGNISCAAPGFNASVLFD